MPLHSGRPVPSAEQEFVEDEDEAEAGKQVVEKKKGKGRSVESRGSKAGSNTKGARNGGGFDDPDDIAQEGEEDDGEDEEEEEESEEEEPNSDDQAFIDDASVDDNYETVSDDSDEEDGVEIIDPVAEDLDGDDSDIELVADRSIDTRSPVKASTSRAGKEKDTSKARAASDVRRHHTETIFYGLQEIVEQVRILAVISIAQLTRHWYS